MNMKMDMDIDADTVTETDMETNMDIQRFIYRISVAKFIENEIFF